MSVEGLDGLARAVDHLARTYSPEQCERMRANLAAHAAGEAPVPRHPLQRPRRFFYAGLPEQPWYERDEFPELAHVAEVLETSFSEIRSEYRASSQLVLDRYSSSALHQLPGDAWAGFTLWDRGRFTPSALTSFPRTCETIASLSAMLFPLSGEVVFLRLRPHTRVPAHSDSWNAQITCHLGVDIPEGCGIRVGAETRAWREGKVLFFDHSFDHEVWNDGDRDRVVLLLNLVHPALTRAERHLLAAIAERSNHP